MTGSTDRPSLLRLTAVISAAALTLGLAACAPEPDVAPTGKPAAGSSTDAQNESSWPESDAADTEKVTMLPATFPGADVPLPANPEVDNAGERGEGAWFVVLRAASLEAASEMIDQIASDGVFTVSNDAETGDGGRSVTLSSDQYVIEALTLTEGTQALLSLDVTQK